MKPYKVLARFVDFYTLCPLLIFVPVCRIIKERCRACLGNLNKLWFANYWTAGREKPPGRSGAGPDKYK